YPSELEVSCRLLQEGKSSLTAEVQDISQTGLRLQLKERFEPGALLAVEIADQQSRTALLLCMQVCWVRECAPGRWELGCVFTSEMSKSEPNILLGSRPSTAVIPRT